MTWRRIAPWVIIAIFFIALFISIPRVTFGMQWLPSEVAGIQFRTILGLDLQGGIRIRLQMQPEEGQVVTPEDAQQARDIIERRVAGIGVTEPQVFTEVGADGRQRIVVDVPGVRDPDQVRRLVGSTGQLQFIDPQAQQLAVDQDIRDLVRDGAVGVLFDGGDIQQGSVVPSTGQGGQLGVSFRLSDRASQIWCEFTTANIRRPGPIALDGRIITTPEIQDRICTGETIITVGGVGRAAEAERTELYNTLRFGALPVALQEQSVEQVAPTLGEEFLFQALVAGAIGLALVVLFMVAYYRLPGLLAALALIFYTLLVYAVFRTIGVTLTLAGVAAFILSIGMAVDANILIFERMKEELRSGKTLGPAIENGFSRAWSSIVDSNVSTIIVAAWLYWQGTTVIRGFALVLIIGVAISMFSAIIVTRTMLRLVVRTDWGRRLRLYHVER